MSRTRDITLVHFNDVYHVSDINHVARFASIMTNPHHLTPGQVGPPPNNLLRVFSGDAFSPSLEASVFRGGHMPEVLNAMKIDVACYGNHDFDFGERRLAELSDGTAFPWTLANVLRREGDGDDGGDAACAGLLARAREYVVREVDGVRVGFFGLAGSDWPSNCLPLPPCDIKDPPAFAHTTARHLRECENCHVVIALTHMRLAEDMAVLKKTQTGSERIDLLLGGHDHDVVQRASTDSDTDPSVAWESLRPVGDGAGAGGLISASGDVRIVKSGTDWKGLSVVRLRVGKDADGRVSVLNTTLTQVPDIKALSNYNQIPMCPTAVQVMTDIQARLAKVVTNPLVMTDVPLEGRSSVVRGREANLGNMLADMVRAYYDTDIALVNSGGIRCDRIIHPGRDEPLLVRDMIDINPFDNAIVVRRISGDVLAEALENSVSDAHTDGRFLQVSGLRMTVDWTRPEGSRVRSMQHVPSGNSTAADVRPECSYTVAMVEFIASGFDGYSCFHRSDSLLDAEAAMTDTNLLLSVFKAPAGAAAPDNSDGGASLVGVNPGGIHRAQRAVISRRHAATGLPVVSPCVDGRIKVTGKS
ncbi:hypothetical protein E4U55_005217 [Claviceps digitariae]|nr:hypothetical protein E4U55_005217 [Claviceps digitariae]